MVNKGVVRVLGRPLDADPLVRLVGLRLFLRRYYGVFVDAHGLTFSDVDETVGRIRSLKPEAWVAAWQERAEFYERLGRTAAVEGRSTTAADLLRQASAFYRVSELALVNDSDLRQGLHRASVKTFVEAGVLSVPPLQRVEIPVVGAGQTIGYLRVPLTPEPPPVVLIVPGLGMMKEHGDFPQEGLLARGVAALTIDLPGQGENRGKFPLDRAWADRLISSAIDFLQTRPDVDAARLGILGTSMGAAAAMFAASTDKRIRALVEISGFYEPSGWWHDFLADGIKEFLRYIVGARDQTELYELVRSANLRGRVAEISCPILVVHGTKDQIIPATEADLVYAEANAPKERLIFPSGDHGCVNVGEARPLIADWLAGQLRMPAR